MLVRVLFVASLGLPLALAAVALSASGCGDTCPEGWVCLAGVAPTASARPTPTATATGTSTAPSPPRDAGAPPGKPDAGYPDGSVPAASATLTVLAYRVKDARYSGSLSAIVTISDTPSNALHILDPVSGADRAVALPAAPLALALSPDGATAAVAFDANVATVDLAGATIAAACPTSTDASSVALSSTNVAYVAPKTGTSGPLYAVDLGTCAVTASKGGIFEGAHLALHPTEIAVFASSAATLEHCDPTTSPIACASAQATGTAATSLCDGLWISADGQRIYGACGQTLRVPGAITTDPCTYGGALGGVTHLRYLSEATAAGRVVMVPGNPQSTGPTDPHALDDVVVRVHETAFLGYVAQYELPMFPIAGGASHVWSHGRFVFATPAMDTVFAIVQADPSGGALDDYGLVTLVP